MTLPSLLQLQYVYNYITISGELWRSSLKWKGRAHRKIIKTRCIQVLIKDVRRKGALAAGVSGEDGCSKSVTKTPMGFAGKDVIKEKEGINNGTCIGSGVRSWRLYLPLWGLMSIWLEFKWVVCLNAQFSNLPYKVLGWITRTYWMQSIYYLVWFVFCKKSETIWLSRTVLIVVAYLNILSIYTFLHIQSAWRITTRATQSQHTFPWRRQSL